MNVETGVGLERESPSAGAVARSLYFIRAVFWLLPLWSWGSGLAAQSPCLRESEREVRSIQSMRRTQAADSAPVSFKERALSLSRETFRTRADSALATCIVAELLKRAGDPAARDQYRRAIALDPAAADVHWLYGDYLRVYRGAAHPLAQAAEGQYYAALRVLSSRQDQQADADLSYLIHRSLIALYETDGAPLTGDVLQHPPRLFLSANAGGGTSLPGDGVDDVRAFTSEALFAASPARLNAPLTDDQLRGILRSRGGRDAGARLRLRQGRLPMIELSARGRVLGDAQITNFFEPRSRNEVTVRSIGIASEASLDLYPAFAAFVRVDQMWGDRTGLIEFAPDAKEHSATTRGDLVVSRSIGPNKLDLEFVAARDVITQDVAEPLPRGFHVFGPTVRLQLFGDAAYDRRLAPRSSDVYAGATVSGERFGSVDIRHTDMFVGATARALPAFRAGQSIDVTVQPSYFASERRARSGSAPVDPQRSSQVRTNVIAAYRVIDLEARLDTRDMPNVQFFNLLFIGAQDAAVDGPADYVSTRLGLGVAAKVVATGIGGGTSFLFTVKAEHQRFAHLDRRLTTVSFAASMGF